MTLADGFRLTPLRRVALADDEARSLATPDDAIVMIRPEHLYLDAAGGDAACRVLRVELLGGLIRYRVQSAIAPQPILVETTRLRPHVVEGGAAWLSLPAADAILYHR